VFFFFAVCGSFSEKVGWFQPFVPDFRGLSPHFSPSVRTHFEMARLRTMPSMEEKADAFTKKKGGVDFFNEK